MKTTTTVLIIAFSAVFLRTIGVAQTQRQLEERYSKVNAYLVRPNILLTARYSSDGRVCEMALQPVRWAGSDVVLFPLSEEETVRVVEEIVPDSERGKRKGGPFDNRLSVFSGHSMSTPYLYEKITIDFVGTTEKGGADMVAVVTWNNRSCN